MKGRRSPALSWRLLPFLPALRPRGLSGRSGPRVVPAAARPPPQVQLWLSLAADSPPRSPALYVLSPGASLGSQGTGASTGGRRRDADQQREGQEGKSDQGKKKLLLNSTQQVVARVRRDLALVPRLGPPSLAHCSFGECRLVSLWQSTPKAREILPLGRPRAKRCTLSFLISPTSLSCGSCYHPSTADHERPERRWAPFPKFYCSRRSSDAERVCAIPKSPGHRPQPLSSARLLSDHSARTCRARASLGVRGAREERDPR